MLYEVITVSQGLDIQIHLLDNPVLGINEKIFMPPMRPSQKIRSAAPPLSSHTRRTGSTTFLRRSGDKDRYSSLNRSLSRLAHSPGPSLAERSAKESAVRTVRPALSRARAIWSRDCSALTVITSYSIHYTKLYDSGSAAPDVTPAQYQSVHLTILSLQNKCSKKQCTGGTKMCLDKKIDKKKFFKKITVLAAGILIIGCAGWPKPEPAQTALGKWHSWPINADGSKKEWPRSTPQYKDSETDTKMWISNNAEQICLLAEIKDPGIARQLTQDGLILSVETEEKDAKPFSIQLKGHASFTPPGRPGPTPGAKLPDSLVVTYPFSSGPVTMYMKEARATGIALGLADAGSDTLIFEAVISLDSIFFDVPRIPGTVIHIALSAIV